MNKTDDGPMFRAEGIHKSYRQPSGRLDVLKGVSLEVRRGDVLTIIGPSGAGKSTLLHVLGGLDRPDKGRVFFDGEEVYRLGDTARSRIRNAKIGFVFQFYHLLPEFSAVENVMLPAMVHARGVDMTDLKAKGLVLLEKVGLKERAQHKPAELSGGEQQRVAIARALMNEPKLIFCDEPTGNLDSESGRAIIALLLELNAKNRQTLVIVTHDEDIARRSGRVVYMKDGILVKDRAEA